ncbi:MAG: hypothetical protein K2X01_01175 [Cyanobacteria bacterium]|nr:hypothetical protein [Cyanobacteriota bacterium]
MLMHRYFKALKHAFLRKAHGLGMSMAEVLVSIAVTGVIASIAATSVVKSNSEDWGKQTQLMMNRVSAAAYGAQLKYGKPYLTATDTNGNLIYPNGMVSLLGSLDKAVKTTTSNGVTTFYYPGNMTMSVGSNLATFNNNDGFAASANSTAAQYIKLSFTNNDPASDTSLSVASGNTNYFIVPNDGRSAMTWHQFDSSAPSGFFDTFTALNQPNVVVTNNNGGGNGANNGGGAGNGNVDVTDPCNSGMAQILALSNVVQQQAGAGGNVNANVSNVAVSNNNCIQ